MKLDIPAGSRVLAALSGGVDSSIAAYRLVRAGTEVVGVTMHLIGSKDCVGTTDASGGERACCSIEAAREARRAADFIGIPHHVIDFRDVFADRVIRPVRESYARGLTPNPCVLCNRYIKFDVLFEWAAKFGCAYVATGHYARIMRDDKGLHLVRGMDASKDQSYFLSYLTESQLERIVFPLGWDMKEDVKSEAKEIGLGTADRPESQDLCFVVDGEPEVRIEGGKAGEIVTIDGTVIGHHAGIGAYTRGQRRGLPGGFPQPLYVIDIDPATNRIIVGPDSESFSLRFSVEDVSLVSRKRDIRRLDSDVMVQIRYRSVPIPGKVTLDDSGGGRVELKEPARAITPGQVAAWYDGDEVLGAGTISMVER